MSGSPLYPGAVSASLPEAVSQSGIRPRLVILHTNGGAATSTPAQLFAYESRTDVVIESHFDVGLDGQVLQTMPVNVRADANAQANRFQVAGDLTWYGAVSIETQDHGYSTVPTDLDPWTIEQIDAMVGILRWLQAEWGIPLRRVDAWNGAGVGAHRDFPEWTRAGHSCPGDARFGQVPDLIARAASSDPNVEVIVQPNEFVADETNAVWEIGTDWKGSWARQIDVGNRIDWRLWAAPSLRQVARDVLQANERKPEGFPEPAPAPPASEFPATLAIQLAGTLYR